MSPGTAAEWNSGQGAAKSACANSPPPQGWDREEEAEAGNRSDGTGPIRGGTGEEWAMANLLAVRYGTGWTGGPARKMLMGPADRWDRMGPVPSGRDR